MKRKLIAVIFLMLSLCLCFTLLSCGSGDGNQANNEPTKEEYGLNFKLKGDNTGYVVSGETGFQGGRIVIPSEHNGKPVTHIDSNAFEDFSTLTSIEIPSSVTSIGAGAFRGCASLTSITIPNSVTSIGESAFYDCTNQTSITISNSVTSIGKSAFFDCDSLTNVTFEEGSQLTSIGSQAFSGCTNLISIMIPDCVTNMGVGAFYSNNALIIYCEAQSIPSGWDSRWYGGSRVVWDCKNNEVADDGYIYKVIDGIIYGIKDDVATVVEQPKNIEGAVIIPKNIKQQGEYYPIYYPVTSIGNYAFDSCKSLTSVTIPSSVTSIGSWSFYHCTALTIYCEMESKPNEWSRDWNAYDQYKFCPVVWNCNNNDIASNGYIYTVIDGIRYEIQDNVAEVTKQPNNIKGDVIIPESITYKEQEYPVKSIKYRAFYKCTSLTSITIPESVTSIGTEAFYYCTSIKYNEYDNGYYIGNEENPYLVLIKARDTSITSCEINENTRFIHSSAFYKCTSLTSITIPNSVISIGDAAFKGCTDLTIYCEAESNPNGWDYNWNPSDCPVVWGYKEEN